jgi:ABC-type bacteriocin/lantibiotic exporter with double-glycine peptidase domain
LLSLHALRCGGRAGKKLEEFLGEVELKGVAFRYPARPLVPIFEKLSVHVPPGTTLALVGQSGSGKCALWRSLLPHLRSAKERRTGRLLEWHALSCRVGER